MPVVFRIDGFRFHFYSNEGDPLEPVHIHVSRAGCEAKLWLSPEVHEAYNDGYDARTMRRVTKLVIEHRQELIDGWNDFFSQTGRG